MDDRETAMNTNIEMVAVVLSSLCDMVRDINAELVQQNQQLEVIHRKVKPAELISSHYWYLFRFN